jgi:Holliday junction resolvasome RuvABC endonuclease subunit
MLSTKPPTILGLDPGTRFMGAAVIQSTKLCAYGVHELRNGDHPVEAIDQARRIVFRYIEQHLPEIVAIEAPYLIATKRGAMLTTLAHELDRRAQDLGLSVLELSPESVRRVVAGNARATKIDVAAALVTSGFGELRQLIPKKPARSGLGLAPRDRYWLHMFDALALATAARSPEGAQSA